MKINLKKMASFGVAGNFTGHLEQAGEDKDFKNIITKEENAPKALFPTYIPDNKNDDNVPSFLKTFPFSSKKIIFPKNEINLQIEPECAIIFKVEWKDDKVQSLVPVCFGASNDCSIRKEGAKKISIKKNWGKCSKGFSNQLIELDSFTKDCILKDYRIASFLIRDDKVYSYGEDSAVRTYSYIYEKLTSWIIDKLNNQKDEGPAENINIYLNEANQPEKILVSIGATRYTEFGQNNYLKINDDSVVVLYPETEYSSEQIKELILKNRKLKNCSILRQKIKSY